MRSLTASLVAAGTMFALATAPFDALQAASLGDQFAGANGIAGFDNIKTAHINFNLNGNFSLPVHFTASSKSTTISADRASGNSKQKRMHATGHVVVHQGESSQKDKSGKLQTQPPSTLTSDELDVDGAAKVYTASGNMHFTQVGGRDATADSATLDDINHRLHMQGNVHVRDKDRTINANVIDYDTLSGQIEADGSVAVAAPPNSLSPASPGAGPFVPSGVAGFDQIETAHIGFNYGDGDFTLPSHFSAASKDTTLVADRATGNSTRKLLHASGNVVVHQDAQERRGAGGKLQAQAPSTLTSDQLDIDGIAKSYTATGNMHFSQEGGRTATADTATLNDASHTLHMQGNVHIRDKARSLAANTVDYDTLTQQIVADGNVTITAPAETPAPGAKRVTPLRKKKII